MPAARFIGIPVPMPARTISAVRIADSDGTAGRHERRAGTRRVACVGELRRPTEQGERNGATSRRRREANNARSTLAAAAAAEAAHRRVARVFAARCAVASIEPLRRRRGVMARRSLIGSHRIGAPHLARGRPRSAGAANFNRDRLLSGRRRRRRR